MVKWLKSHLFQVQELSGGSNPPSPFMNPMQILFYLIGALFVILGGIKSNQPPAVAAGLFFLVGTLYGFFDNVWQRRQLPSGRQGEV